MSVPAQFNRVLSCGNLPSLPSVGIQVLALTRKPDVKVEEIAKVIETDPALSAKVLRTVNSSLFGLQSPCTTIRRALGYLGLNAVKSVVLGFSLVDSARSIGTEAGFDVNEHWRRTIYASAGARTIARALNSCDPEEAFTAALFQDLGSLAMFSALKGEYTAALAAAPADHARHSELERAAFGFTHMDIGACLAGKWRLPDRYVQVIRFHHDPDNAEPAMRNLVRTAALGTAAALTFTSAAPADHLARLLGLAQHWFGKSPREVQAMLDAIGVSAAELARVFEKSLGEPPDVEGIMEQANEALVASQIAAQRESEELREHNEALARQATTDALTGLKNRKAFDDESRRLFDDASRLGRTFALLMLDGDRFKSVNDTHGHHVGDAVLRELARRITAAVAGRGIVCRYGGEEFTVLLPGSTLPEATSIAEAVRKAVQIPEFTFAGVDSAPPSLPVTVSIGVSVTDPAAGGGQTFPTFAAMIEASDKALYQAKHAGRNQVCTGQPPGAEPVPSAVPTAAQPALSIAGMPGSPLAAAPAGPTGGPHTRFFLVEDDALSAKLLTMLLQKGTTVEIEWVRDGRAAIKRLTECARNPASKPHVIICDQMLTGCDGLTVLRFCRSLQTLAKIPFVMLSASIEPRLVKECTAAGATLFLHKTDLAQNLPKWMHKIGAELAQAGRAA